MVKFTILLIATCLAVFLLPASQILPHKLKVARLKQQKQVGSTNANELGRLQLKAAQLKKFATNNQLNTKLAFLVDMQIHSGKKRFFVYDLSADSVIASGLVTHGSGMGSTAFSPQFGNKVGGLSTSLGFYKIGSKYSGQYGTAYKLHGLESTNNKAFERSVVLHSHTCVPNKSSYPLPICMSYGCPTVAPEFLKKLESIIDKTTLPVVLSVYY